MGKWVRILSSFVRGCALSLFARPASATQPATAGELQGNVGFRYGFELEESARATRSPTWVSPGAEFMVITGAVALSADVRYEMIFRDSTTLNGLILSAGVGF